MLRVVVDPGVLVSAALSPAGQPADLIRRWHDGAFDLIVSANLLAELRETLRRRKFRRYLDDSEAAAFVAALAERALVAEDPADPERITADPNDDYIVALARAARAHVIVSGDQHLTSLHIRPPVLTPREFLDRLGSV